MLCYLLNKSLTETLLQKKKKKTFLLTKRDKCLMITILFVVSKCLAFLNGFLKKRKVFFNGNRYADNQYKILAYGLSVENFFFFFYMRIRHGKMDKNFLIRPDLTQTQFFDPKQKWVDPWLNSCFLWVNPTRSTTWTELEPFFLNFFFWG